VSVCWSRSWALQKKTAEPIEMPFGGLTWVGPGNHALNGPRSPWGRDSFSGLSICPAYWKAFGSLLLCTQKRLNRSRCRLGANLCEPTEPCDGGRSRTTLFAVMRGDKSVILAHGWTVQKQLNRSRCRLGADSCAPKEPCVRWESRRIRLPPRRLTGQRCGL